MKNKYIDISKIEMNSNIPKFDFNLNNGAYELAISLFEKCNMRCKFCFQSHNGEVDLQYIRNIPYLLRNKLYSEIKKYNIRELNVKIWGGEVFLDNIESPIELFTEYKLLMSDLFRMFKYIERRTNLKRINFRWLTNGIFNSKILSYVLNFVDEYNISIGMSFDPERFKNNSLFYKWVSNYVALREFTDVALSITLSKQNINEYLHGDGIYIKIFKDILKSKKISPSSVDISYYTASSNWKEDLPSEEDLFQFFRWCIDNNFRVIKVIDDIYNTFNGEDVLPYCDCVKAATFVNGKLIKNCADRSSLCNAMFYGDYNKFVTEENCGEYKNSLGLIKQGCITCEYSNNCQKLCWLSVIFKFYETGNCPFKRIYKYLEWRNSYAEP